MKFPLVLRSRLERAERTIKQYQQDEEKLYGSLGQMTIRMADLEARVKKAEKNDHRDPKTGRFIKGE